MEQLPLIGREHELVELDTFLKNNENGIGGTIFISGEAGIGKTRLLNELKKIAASKGFQVLQGNCYPETMTAFMPLREALGSVGLDYLLAAGAPPRVELAYIITKSGLVLGKCEHHVVSSSQNSAKSEPAGLGFDADIFTSMLTAVGKFVKDSISQLAPGQIMSGGLNKLGYRNWTILLEPAQDLTLVTVISGRENEFLIEDMREVAGLAQERYGSILKNWNGRMEAVEGIEKLLEPLVLSGKYDGTDYTQSDLMLKRENIIGNAAKGLCRLAKAKPLLLIVDDLQWADSASLAFLHHLARTTKRNRIYLACAYRTEELNENSPLAEMLRLLGREILIAKKLELKRLASNDTEKMISASCPNNNFTPEFISQIHQYTDGNPLFILELLNNFREEGIIAETAGCWQLSREHKEINIPATVHDILVRRLANLPKEHRNILNCASVIGTEFELDTVCCAIAKSFNISRAECLRFLNDIERLHKLLYSYENRFRFNHPLIRDTLYTELSEPLRREYHSTIAECVAGCAMNEEEKVSRLAYHYYHAADIENAIKYLQQAAELAAAKFANEEAIIQYKRLQKMLEHAARTNLPLYTETLTRLGNLLLLSGKLKDALEFFERAMRSTEDNEKQAYICTGICTALEHMGKYDEIFKVTTLHLNKLKIKSVHIGKLHLALGTIYWRRGELKKALQRYKLTMKIFDQCNAAPNYRALVLNALGNYYRTLGNIDQATKYYLEGMKIAEKVNDLKTQSMFHNNLAVLYAQTGEPDNAREHFEKSLAIKQKLGDRLGMATAYLNLGSLDEMEGKFDSALKNLHKSLKLSEDCGDPVNIASVYNTLGLLYRDMGNPNEALKFVHESLKLREQVGIQDGIARSTQVLGQIYLDLNDFSNAERFLNESIELSKKVNNKRVLASNLRTMAELSLKKKDLKKALKFASYGLKLATEVAAKDIKAECTRMIANILIAAGDLKNAEKKLKKSAKIFSKAGMRFEQAKTLCDIIAVKKAKGDEAESIQKLSLHLKTFFGTELPPEHPLSIYIRKKIGNL